MHDAGYMIQDERHIVQDKGSGPKSKQKPQSYKDLEVYTLGKVLAVKVHKLTIEELPKFEIYEEGSQIRRSSKSIVANLVEGFGRRKYLNEFIRFLTYSIASCDETKVHLEMLYETESIPKEDFESLCHRYEELGAKLYNFREAVTKSHRTG
jgi:four helix bundle protein